MTACRERIAALDSRVELVIEGVPVHPDDVELAELILRARLPESYTQLMIELGAFKLDSRWQSPYRSFELLTPARMVQETEIYRKIARTVDDDVRATADEFAILQFAITPVDFFVLRLADGMVHRNVHDDVFHWDRGRSFDDHLAHVLDEMAACAGR